MITALSRERISRVFRARRDNKSNLVSTIIRENDFKYKLKMNTNLKLLNSKIDYNLIGIKFRKGQIVVPQGTIILGSRGIKAIAITLSLINSQFTIEYYEDIVLTNVKLFNKLICSNNITNGTKMYKTIWDYTLQLARGENPKALD